MSWRVSASEADVSSLASRQSQDTSLLASPPRSLNLLAATVTNKKRHLAVSLVDLAYLHQALNFRLLSLPHLPPHCPHVFICMDSASQAELRQRGIYCFLYGGWERGPGGDFGSVNYFAKTHAKTLVARDLLLLGYNVLVIDPDVALFKDPFPYFTCENCDVVASVDRVQVNTGFLYARATVATKALYAETWRLTQMYNKSHDQSYFNTALSLKNMSTIKLDRLSPKEFLCGAYYFDGRMFGDKPCDDCVMVHNNYIGSLTAKEYRFKENHLWLLDEDGYYSSDKTKYLTYSNPYYFGDDSWERERRALIYALHLGTLTGRVVILPRFHSCDCTKSTCYGSRYFCSMLYVLKIKTFDAVYKGKYRESTFLKHPLTRRELRESHTVPFVINSTLYDTRNLTGHYQWLQPETKSLNAWRTTLLKLLMPRDKELLWEFHSLYEAFPPSLDKYLANWQDTVQCGTQGQWNKEDIKDPLLKKLLTR